MVKRLLSSAFMALLLSASFGEEAVINLPKVTTFVKDDLQEQKIIISAETIASLHEESVQALLQSFGIELKSYGGYGTASSISIRGFRGKDIAVTVDGVLSNSKMSGEFDFNSIPISQIEKIEIIKGAFVSDASIEGGVGGLVNIVTKKQYVGWKTYVDVSGLTYFNKVVDTGRFNVGGVFGSGNSTWSFNGNTTIANNKFPYKDGLNTIDMFHSSVIDGGVSAQFLTYFDNGSEFLVRNRFYIGDKKVNGGVLSDWGPSQGRQKDLNNSLLVTYNDNDLGYDWSLNTSIQYDYTLRSYDTYGANPSSDTHEIHSVQTTTLAKYSNYQVFEQSVGLNFNVSFIDSTKINRDFYASGFFKESTQIYIGDSFSVVLPLTLSFSGNNVSFIPKLGLQYGFEKGVLSLNAYRLHLFPTLNDLYFEGGNPNLKPENGVGGELTLNMYDITFPFSASVFSNYYFDKIIWKPENPSDSSAPWTPVNIGEVFYLGADFLVNNRITDFFSLRLNYQAVISWLLGDFSFKGNKRVVYTPVHTLGVGGTFYWSNVSLTVTGNYVGSRYIDEANTSELPSYFLLDIVGNVQLTDWLDIYAQISNSFNENYYLTKNYPVPGISATLGLKLNVGK